MALDDNDIHLFYGCYDRHLNQVDHPLRIVLRYLKCCADKDRSIDLPHLPILSLERRARWQVVVRDRIQNRGH
jgi:hypothetical protein